MKKRFRLDNVSDWIKEEINRRKIPATVFSAHIDEFSSYGYKSVKRDANQIIKFGLDLFKLTLTDDVQSMLRPYGLKPFLFFYLEPDDHSGIRFWSDDMFSLLERTARPPEIYLTSAPELFEIDNEEYRRVVKTKLIPSEFLAIYQCARRSEEVVPEDFQLGIYVFRRGDFR